MLAVQQWLPEAPKQKSANAPRLPLPRASRLLSETNGPLPAYQAYQELTAAAAELHGVFLPLAVTSFSEKRRLVSACATGAWAA